MESMKRGWGAHSLTFLRPGPIFTHLTLQGSLKVTDYDDYNEKS